MIEFDIKESLINSSDLNAFENNIGYKLPLDYKQHMLKYNGGAAKTTGVFFGKVEDDINLYYFHPLKNGSPTLEKMREITQDFLPQNHISIARTETGGISMSLGAQDSGSVFVYYPDQEPMKISNSFTELLEGLVDYGDDYDD